jgi:hypothetical protein
MSANEERRGKARHDVTQFYQRKKDVSRREMPRGVMTISGDPNSDNSSSSLDDDIEDDTYVPSPRAHPHGKGLASASGSRAGRDDKIEEEAEEGADGDEEEEVFDVEQFNPPNYVDMGSLVFRAPTNPTSRVKVSYKGKTESMRENRRILARTQPRDAYDYRFHSLFQQDFNESVIMTKSKSVTNSQWIDWAYMENKYDPIFNRVIAACQAKHLRDILAFKKDWNNEVITQFGATVCFEEHGDTRKLHWMTESQWYEVSYSHFARLFGFGQKDASRPRIHLALKLEARKIKFMYPRSKQGNFGDTTDMLPFYAYLN